LSADSEQPGDGVPASAQRARVREFAVDPARPCRYPDPDTDGQHSAHARPDAVAGVTDSSSDAPVNAGAVPISTTSDSSPDSSADTRPDSSADTRPHPSADTSAG